MKQLVRVRGNRDLFGFFMDGLRTEPQAIMGKVFNVENDDYETTATFFLVEDFDVDTFVKELAQKRPGTDIEVYTLEKVGHCPAGEFTMKVVTADGILPMG